MTTKPKVDTVQAKKVDEPAPADESPAPVEAYKPRPYSEAVTPEHRKALEEAGLWRDDQ